MSVLLSVRDLSLRRAGTEVLRAVTLHASRNEIVAVMGLSGGGKTTILRSIAALEPFDAGTIEIDGVTLSGGSSPSPRTMAALRRRVGMVFQHHSLFEHMTALENVTLAPMQVSGLSRRAAEERALALLESLAVAHRRGAYPRELSGGEAQRVAIARAMAMDPPLLLMDEPTAALDPARRSELGQTLQRLAAQGRTLLIATHDQDFAQQFAHRRLALVDGRVERKT